MIHIIDSKQTLPTNTRRALCGVNLSTGKHAWLHHVPAADNETVLARYGSELCEECKRCASN